MKRHVYLLLLLILSFSSSFGQLYSKAYGSTSDPAIIFLHGGPGYNSVNFEFTTAQNLADKGFYVIVYDQRGSGRSKNMTGNKFTLEEAMDDLKGLYEKHAVKKATLIGHSWGGTLATYFAAVEPEMTEKVILVGSPYSYQMTLRTIIGNSENVYRLKNDSVNLRYISLLRAMDTASLQYSSYAFMHAMSSGLYSVKQRTKESTELYKALQGMPEAKYLSASEYAPVQGLYQNERYTTISIAEPLRKALNKGVSFYGIYGDEDGLFDIEQLNIIRRNLGDKNFKLIKGASHNVFIDQQATFIDQVVAYIQEK